MTALADEYATALAAALADDLAAYPAPGALARVVIRWFEGPLYLTVHALGSAEEPDIGASDAWYPLEWPNEPVEIGRADRVVEVPAVAAAGTALEAELEDGVFAWGDDQPAPLIEAARRLRDALVARGVAVADHFAVGVAHFEGWGPESSVPAANPPETLALLSARGVSPMD